VRCVVDGVGDGLAVVGSGEYHLLVALDLAPDEGCRSNLVEVGLLWRAIVRDGRRYRLTITCRGESCSIITGLVEPAAGLG
jgi:hypothetical protein